ncbi:prolipoprotein diacylglyceryl transferase [Candidatus Gracilibacteria bacterium]|nr:prolipoprotein diacylglyceryl transferase [Candidatus Gracilibacteria bacterium]
MNFSRLSFGFFALEIYGVILAIAFVIATWHYYKTLQDKRFPMDFFLRNFWKWLISGVVVGRLFSFLLNSDIFMRNGLTSFFEFWDGRINFLGLLVGFLGMMWWNTKKSKIDFWQWIDGGVKSFFIGILMVDVAAFLTGSIYGKETIMPWGVQYETFGVDILMPTHPVALYAFLAHCFVFVWIRNNMKELERIPGKLALRAGILLFGIDFLLQFFRGDPTFLVGGTIRIEHIFDVIVIVFLFFIGQRKVAKF